jgi:hypothetical protein
MENHHCLMGKPWENYGKMVMFDGKSDPPFSSWVNPLFRLGHVQ